MQVSQGQEKRITLRFCKKFILNCSWHIGQWFKRYIARAMNFRIHKTQCYMREISKNKSMEQKLPSPVEYLL
jgi:hypothetical protein